MAAASAQPQDTPALNPPGTEEQPTDAPIERSVTLAAVGDILLHPAVYEDARTAGGFDFEPMLEAVREELRSADITIANQESVPGGTDVGLSGYPSFNSPFEIADALQAAGVDLLSMANNHALDRGEKTLRSAIAHLKSLGLEYIGASESEQDRGRLRVLERGGLKLAFAAYTFGTNGIASPPGRSYLVHRIADGRMAQELAAARQQADAVIVSLHFGREYDRMPDRRQRELVREAARAGADVIIGHHPHVLQPLEWVDNGRGGRSLAVYSLGNFLAGQQHPDPHTRLGGILRVTLAKPQPEPSGPGASLRLSGVQLLPTFIRREDWHRFRVIPLAMAQEDELREAGIRLSGLREHLRQWMPELKLDD